MFKQGNNLKETPKCTLESVMCGIFFLKSQTQLFKNVGLYLKAGFVSGNF